MPVSRRTLAQSLTAAGVIGLPTVTRAQSDDAATPEGEGEKLTPEATFEALLDAEVVTPLFPADTGEIVITEWDDDGDTDLEGVIGGLLLGSADDEDLFYGAMIVHPDTQSAEDKLEQNSTEDESSRFSIFGFDGLTGVVLGSPESDLGESSSYAITVVRVNETLVSGFAEGDGPIMELATRSFAYAAALVDQYFRVTGIDPTEQEMDHDH